MAAFLAFGSVLPAFSATGHDITGFTLLPMLGFCLPPGRMGLTIEFYFFFFSRCFTTFSVLLCIIPCLLYSAYGSCALSRKSGPIFGDRSTPHGASLGADLFSALTPRIIDLVDACIVATINKRLHSELLDTDSLFVTQFNEQMTQWQANTLPVLMGRAMAGLNTSHRPEPPILNVTFSGSHSHLLNFVHVIKDSLARHHHSFSDDTARIKWVARHLTPVGSASHNWWMKLVRQNAAAQNVTNVFEAPGLPFITPTLASVDVFLRALVAEFKDKYAAENALKDLQSLKQGDKRIGEFNSLFTSVLSLLLDLPEQILIDFYKNSLNVKILAQAIGRTDWASATTLKARQEIAVLASDQMDEMKRRNANPLHMPITTAPTSQGVAIPQDPNSMDIDVHALTTSSPFPHDKFKTTCHCLRLCTRCLGPWTKGADNRHTCVYAPATLQAKIDFLKGSASSQRPKTSSLPTTVSYPPAGPPAPVVPVASLSSGQLMVPQPHTSYAPQPHFFPHHPSYGYVYPAPSVPLPSAPPVFSSVFMASAPSVPMSSAPTVFPSPSYPLLPPSPAVPHPTVPLVSPPPLPTMQTSGVSAVFSEYANLTQLVYYDLPGTSYDSDGPQISSVHFSNSQSDSIRLVLSISLYTGLHFVHARALVDPGSEGDFLNPSFAAAHGLNLSLRRFPLQCNGFDGTPSVHGPITHRWDGRMFMRGDAALLFESSLALDVTPIGGFRGYSGHVVALVSQWLGWRRGTFASFGRCIWR